jgi:peptide/nickel transport system substrate-binding protein
MRGPVPARLVTSLLVAIVTATAFMCGACHRRERPLVVTFSDVPASLDPHLQNQSVAWSVLGNIYDGLVRFSPSMQLEPALAVSWVTDGENRWQLRLRPGARFHDGELLTADDVVASFERARDHPRSLVRHHLAGVRAVRKVDDLTVEIETAGPAPNLLNRLTFIFIVPARLAGTEEITSPIGTGPYRFVRRSGDGTVELRGFAGWHGMPEIDHVLFTFYEDSQVAADKFFSGGVDLLHSLPDSQVPLVQGQPGLRAEPQPRLAVQMLAVIPTAASGAAHEALADQRVRRAMLLALNRTGWTNDIFRGNATAATQYVHPVVFGYDPGITQVPYDPERALRLLAEAGYAQGFEVPLVHGFVTSGVIEALVTDLARVNIRVAARAVAFGEALRMARQGEAPLVFYAWSCSTGDASDFLNSSLHTRDEMRGLGVVNYFGFSDPRVDALLDDADRERDPTVRLAQLQKAQRLSLEALPFLPLTIRLGYEGVSDRLDIITRHDERVLVAAYRWR